MRGIIAAAVIAVGVSALAIAQAPDTTATRPAGTGAISGLVIDAITSAPVAGAIVQFAVDPRQTPSFASPRGTVSTDAKGRFVFTHLSAAQYGISVLASGYFPGVYGNDEPDFGLFSTIMPESRIVLGDGQWFHDAEIRLSRAGSISGTITDERGDPLVSRYVRVLSLDGEGGLPGPRVAGGTLTDDRGVYTIGRLMPGRYVAAVPPFDADDLEGRADGVLMSPRTFYPTADRITNATPITVAPGANVTGIDVTVRARPSHRISGRVDGPPEAWDNLRLALVPADELYVGTSSWLNVVWVENDGTFAFPSVSPGSYLIVSSSWTHQDLLPSGLSGSDRPFTWRPWQLPSDNERRTTFSPYVVRQPIEVGRSDLAGVTLPVRFRNEVSGRIIAASGAIEARRRIDDGTASISAVPVGGVGNDGMRLVRSDTTFFVSDIFERQFFLRGDSPASVMSVTVDGVDMTTQPIDLATGSNHRNIEVTLADTATLKGTIRDGRGPAGRAGVLYFPVQQAAWDQFTSRSPRLGFAIAPSDGSYSTPIPGGRYYVVALSDSARNKWRSVEFLNAASKVATIVDVEWGTTKTLDLQQRELEVKP